MDVRLSTSHESSILSLFGWMRLADALVSSLAMRQGSHKRLVGVSMHGKHSCYASLSASCIDRIYHSNTPVFITLPLLEKQCLAIVEGKIHVEIAQLGLWLMELIVYLLSE